MQEEKDACQIHAPPEPPDGLSTATWTAVERRQLVERVREFEVLLETFRSIRENRSGLPS